jgi:hypothetical protein
MLSIIDMKCVRDITRTYSTPPTQATKIAGMNMHIHQNGKRMQNKSMYDMPIATAHDMNIMQQYAICHATLTTERYVFVYEGPGTPPRATPKQSTASGPNLHAERRRAPSYEKQKNKLSLTSGSKTRSRKDSSDGLAT